MLIHVYSFVNKVREPDFYLAVNTGIWNQKMKLLQKFKPRPWENVSFLPQSLSSGQLLFTFYMCLYSVIIYKLEAG